MLFFPNREETSVEPSQRPVLIFTHYLFFFADYDLAANRKKWPFCKDAVVRSLYDEAVMPLASIPQWVSKYADEVPAF